MSQALYRKYRPHLWDQVVGQEHIVHTLQNAIRSNRVGHAYLFAGPRGTGKTTTARLLAKAVNCLAEDVTERPCDKCEHCKSVNEGRFLDLIEIDAASNTSVEDVRDLRDKINFAPTQGKFKVYIIDEVHMLSTAAFNALLKTLEEPPPHAIFILATTEVHKIPATVLSRCQRHEFRRIPVPDIVRLLDGMAKQEGLEVDPDALTLIARQSTGAMRDAISLLDQLASTGDRITLDLAQTVLGTATSQMVVELTAAILARQTAEGLECIHRTLDSGSDPRQFARQVVDYLRNLMLIRMGNAGLVEATQEQRGLMAQQAQAFEMPRLLEAIRLFNVAASENRAGWQPGLLLELAFSQMVEYSVPAAVPQSTPPPQVTQPTATRPVESKPVETRPVEQKPVESKPSESTPAESKPVESKPVETRPAAPVRKEAGAVSGGSAPDLESIKQNWKKIRELVKKQRVNTEALLNSCKTVTVKGSTLILGFSTDILRGKMETEGNLEIVRQAIKDALGFEPPIRCVVVSSKTGEVPEDMDVDADGMVGAALNLGGKIVQRD